MAKTTFTREFFIPAGATKITDKHSDAVAYIYTNALGKPCARVFYGKQTKPFVACYYKDDAQRAAGIARAFKARQEVCARKAEQVAAKRAFKNPYKVGDVFQSSWGYEQSNVDWYEVIAVSGQMLSIRRLAEEKVVTGWEQGKSVPILGQYIGEPMRVRAQNGYVKTGYAYAFFQKPEMIAGVPVYAAAHWTSYA